MGRAIDMENNLEKLSGRVKRLEDIVLGMSDEIDCLSSKGNKKVEGKKDEKKKANDKGDGKSSESSNTGKSKSTKKSK